MPSITIRFQWDDDESTEEQRRKTLTELAGHLRFRTVDAFTDEGEDLMGYDGALIDEATIDAVIDDGHGITITDRAAAAVDDEHEAKVQSRAEED